MAAVNRAEATLEPASNDDLLQRAAGGERAAFDRLVAEHRPRLVRAVTLRLDRRVAARLDASDVVQDVCVEAFRRLPQYVQSPDLPLEAWLLWLAREQVLMAHRKHLLADRRAVGREIAPLPVESSAAVVLTGGRRPDAEPARRRRRTGGATSIGARPARR
jgi:RNA polymerase sigma-70 factor, ECF subfamily